MNKFVSYNNTHCKICGKTAAETNAMVHCRRAGALVCMKHCYEGCEYLHADHCLYNTGDGMSKGIEDATKNPNNDLIKKIQKAIEKEFQKEFEIIRKLPEEEKKRIDAQSEAFMRLIKSQLTEGEKRK